ncbi:MAG: TetR/AcrR family transcriptional regulator [Streptosporangiaceae bacterium]
MKATRSPARDRVLNTATRLFYAEGVHTVGVDRIIAEAGVAKATFYHHYRSKDDLVCGYLEGQAALQRDAVQTLTGAPLDQINAFFDLLGEVGCGPGFRGCPFLNAAAEYADPAHPVRQVVDRYRRWFREFMAGLLREAGHRAPEATAGLLLILRDGIAVGSGIDDPVLVRAGIGTALRKIL